MITVTATNQKTVQSSIGEVEIEAPRDRKSTFEPEAVKKGQKDISDIDHKIISMYAKGMTTRQISDTIEDIYGFDVSEGFISDVTDKILPQIEDRQLMLFLEPKRQLQLHSLRPTTRGAFFLETRPCPRHFTWQHSKLQKNGLSLSTDGGMHLVKCA